MKTWIVVLFCILGTFVLSIILMLIGMNLFGNYFVDSTFLGGRGYEAGANLGFLIGVVSGLSLSIYILRTHYLKRKHHQDQ